MATPQEQMAGLAARKARANVRIRWFDRQVMRDVTIGIDARVKIAAQMLRDRVVINISRPVTKVKNTQGRIRVDPTSRSKPGEFPKADTTRLMKDVFWEWRARGTKREAIVGTTLDYGLILETRMNRSFLRRTLLEMHSVIKRILTQGKGGGKGFRIG